MTQPDIIEPSSVVTIQIVAYGDAIEVIQRIRTLVFQVEQGVDPALEFDGEDEAAMHLVARLNGHPVGTARVRRLGDRLAKIERVAVLSDYRGRGIGQELMKRAIALLKDYQTPEVKVNAQTHARNFYAQLGFVQRGEEFDEAGIRHIEMRLRLD